MPADKGYIYILTNPSFPDYVKIGYADDVDKRVDELNRSECTPFGFRVFATYEVSGRLKDIPLHDLIDSLNGGLRSRDEINGKIRVREFYALSPDEAFAILLKIAKINGLEDKLVKRTATKEELQDEADAEEIKELALNRHHFKEIDFTSSITGHKYHGKTGSDGTLCIIDMDTGKEVPNKSEPSKKAIVGQAIVDLGGTIDKNDTLYQRYHRLTKMILGK